MIEPLIYVALGVFFIWNTIQSFNIKEAYEIRSIVRDEMEIIKKTILEDINTEFLTESARSRVESYLEDSWYGYPGEGSRLTEAMVDRLSQDVEKEVDNYLSKEYTIDKIVNKLNKKQLKG